MEFVPRSGQRDEGRATNLSSQSQRMRVRDYPILSAVNDKHRNMQLGQPAEPACRFRQARMVERGQWVGSSVEILDGQRASSTVLGVVPGW